MLTLNDGRSELWQWDTGRTLAVDADCSQVHFSNKVFGRSIDVDVADGVAVIPDILLQTDKDLNVWAFVGTAENGYTKISKTFKVNWRNKPADYVFTPTDQMTLKTIQSQIGDLADLTTEAKDTLVAAINEAARTGGGAGSMDLRVADGYVQYSKDGGMTWTNLIAMAELKGADGITPTIGSNGNWYLGDTDTGKPSRGEKGDEGQPGKDGRDGSPGKDGADGKSAYQYAQEGGYTGTEAEFAAKLAAEKFANPNALAFTGAVTGSYDGSEPLTVEIPSGGGTEGKAWTYLGEFDLSVANTVEFTELQNVTEIYVRWADVKNEKTNASAYVLKVNDVIVINGIIPVQTTNTVYGWSWAKYNGLYWTGSSTAGWKNDGNTVLNAASSQAPYYVNTEVGKALSIKLSPASPTWAAATGILNVYVR